MFTDQTDICVVCTIPLAITNRFACSACIQTYDAHFCRHCIALHQNAHKYADKADLDLAEAVRAPEVSVKIDTSELRHPRRTMEDLIDEKLETVRTGDWQAAMGPKPEPDAKPATGWWRSPCTNPLDPEPAQPRYLNYDSDPLVRAALETLEAIEVNRDHEGDLYRNYAAALRSALDIGPKTRLLYIYRDIFAERRTGNPSPTP